MSHEVVVKELCVYPVKGCQGTSLEEVEITKSGLVGDRFFTLLHEGAPLDQIKAPGLGALGVVWDTGARRLHLRHPDHGEWLHEFRASGSSLPGKYVLDHFEGVDQGDEVADWLSAVARHRVRLIAAAKPWSVQLPLPQFDRIHGTEKSRFYAVSPVSLSNVASLDDLNGRLREPVPMDRFRMNVVVEGLEPWDEDRVKMLTSAEVALERVTVAERCIIVTTDQQTGERKKGDLLQTLNRFRRRPKGERFASGLMFGAYMAVAREGRLCVGDRLQVEF